MACWVRLLHLHRNQEFRSCKFLGATGICDPSNSRARHHTFYSHTFFLYFLPSPAAILKTNIFIGLSCVVVMQEYMILWSERMGRGEPVKSHYNEFILSY